MPGARGSLTAVPRVSLLARRGISGVRGDSFGNGQAMRTVAEHHQLDGFYFGELLPGGCDVRVTEIGLSVVSAGRRSR